MADRASAGLRTRQLVAGALVLGLVVGAGSVFLGGWSLHDHLPRETTVSGTVGILNSDGTAFSFATDDGRKIGFSAVGDGFGNVKPGAHLRLLLVDGDGYEVVASATATPPGQG